MKALTETEYAELKIAVKAQMEHRRPYKRVYNDEEQVCKDICKLRETKQRLRGSLKIMANLGKALADEYFKEHSIWDLTHRQDEEPTPTPTPAPEEPAPAPEVPATPEVEEVAEATEDTSAETPAPASNAKNGDALDGLVNLLANRVSQILADKAEEPRPVEHVVVTSDFKATLEGLIHERFDEVLAYVVNKEPVYLAGPAGCGKNHLAEQIAKALGKDFYFTGAVHDEYKLIGFIDAMGVFQETQFYKAFAKGGLFFFDEFDGSTPDAVLTVNAAIANGYMDFPGMGRVNAHPDFCIIAAGNTIGQGADDEYVGRNQLDAATLDRFAVIQMDYDERVELGLTGNDKELVAFAHDVRRANNELGMHLLVSYRALGRIAKMAPVIGLDRAIDTGLIKGLDKADILALTGKMKTVGNKYTSALNGLAL